jgi:2-polyprenyl-3-methyl-5-hydroxy-6-metoxy-1,4-benzoquinol methylase
LRYDYSNQFIEDSQVAKYEHKFTRKIDIVRHRIECQIVRRHATGNLYDCSVGHGRFISELPDVQTYSAMDYSEAFTRYIKTHHPQVTVKKGDLLKGIEEPDDRYDTVLCIRTIAGLGNAAQIIGEMVRIARPGGVIIFDYDRKDKKSTAEILAAHSLTIVKAAQIDSSFSMAIKHHPKLSKWFNHRFNFIPLFIYAALERVLGMLSGERILYIARKCPPTTN